MSWRRLAWLVILLLVTTIVWGATALKETYEKIDSTRSKGAEDTGQRLASLRARLANHREYIENLERLVLWPPGSDLMSWLTQQANESEVRIIGVEHPPVEKVSSSHPRRTRGPTREIPEYRHVPVKITVTGGYNLLGRFINKLEHCPNAIRIDSFRMRRKEYTPEHTTMDLSLSYFQKVEKS
jgi:hypothetical protein